MYVFYACPATVAHKDAFVLWLSETDISFEVSFTRPETMEAMVYSENGSSVPQENLDQIMDWFSQNSLHFHMIKRE